MKNDWILDTLADMRNFAALNGMEELAQQLNIASDVAEREIRCLENRAKDGETDGAGRGANAGSNDFTSR